MFKTSKLNVFKVSLSYTDLKCWEGNLESFSFELSLQVILVAWVLKGKNDLSI